VETIAIVQSPRHLLSKWLVESGYFTVTVVSVSTFVGDVQNPQSCGGGKPGKNVLVLQVFCTYRKRVAAIHRTAERDCLKKA
jgi:hypothetical protein